MSKIISLKARNYKRLVAVEITPDGNIVTINGKNGAGKSSVLDSITAALGGVNNRDTPKPIREGEEDAEIVLETDELIVTRRFTPKGSTLTVTNSDGAKFTKGQAKLDDLLGKLSLDPFAFTQLDEKQQLETLLSFVDLPFDPLELDKQRKELYDQRADIGRQGKAIGEVEVDESLPEQEQSASKLIQQIQETNHNNQKIESAQSQCDNLSLRISDLEQQLTDARHELDGLKTVASQDTVDTSEMEQQLATIEETNAVIRANNSAKSQQLTKDGLLSSYNQITEDIKNLDNVKAQGLSQAVMPVVGLGFDDSGVTFEHIPFKQVNTAAQIRVSFAMAMALNPKLRVVRIAEGSLLDDDNMKLVAEMAAEHDYQVWIEQVGDGDGTGIVIEDGEIKK